MAMASGLFAGPHVARDSGAPGYFCVCSSRLVRIVDDAILLSGRVSRIPRVDDLWEQPDYANAAAGDVVSTGCFRLRAPQAFP
jgi:hypothetical protein